MHQAQPGVVFQAWPREAVIASGHNDKAISNMAAVSAKAAASNASSTEATGTTLASPAAWW